MRLGIFDFRYDVIVGLGQHCANAKYMQRAGLRAFSSPFDWLEGSKVGLLKVVDLIENDLASFLEKDALVPKELTEDEDDGKHIGYIDTKTGFGVFHDFPKNQSFDEAYLDVIAKYHRRMERIKHLVPQAKRALFLYSAVNETLDKAELKDCLEHLRQMFNSERIDLLIIQNDRTVKGVKDASKIIEGVYVITGGFYPLSAISFWGDIRLNDKVYRKIPKALKLEYAFICRQLRELLIRFAACFIINSSARKSFREKLRDRL